MAARPTWQGHLKLSLVTCPVALYTATSSAGHVSFHLINPDTNNRIRMAPVDSGTGEPVERADLVKGFEVSKDEYVLMDDADFEKVKLESTRTIDIGQFVDEDDIDRLYWDDPFYVVPEKGVGAEAFAVIRDAMKAAGKIAIGTLVLRNRERQIALEVRGKGLVAWSLRPHDEVRDAGDFFDDIPAVTADKDMVEIATRIIDQKQADFDPSEIQGPLRRRPEGPDQGQAEGRQEGPRRGARARRHQRHRSDGGVEEQFEGVGDGGEEGPGEGQGAREKERGEEACG